MNIHDIIEAYGFKLTETFGNCLNGSLSIEGYTKGDFTIDVYSKGGYHCYIKDDVVELEILIEALKNSE